MGDRDPIGVATSRCQKLVHEKGIVEEASNFQEVARSLVEPLPSQVHDLKQLLVDIHNQVATAAVRHDELLRQLIGEVREEMSCMRPVIEEAAGVRQRNCLRAEFLSEGKFASVPKTDVTPQCGKSQWESDQTPKGTMNTDVEGQNSRAAGELGYAGDGTLPSNLDPVARSATNKRKREAILHHDQSAKLDRNHTLWQLANHVLKCKEFEFLIALALVCNALVMCFESQYYGLELGYNLQFQDRLKPAHKTWEGAEVVFDVMAWIFGTIFALEFLFKIIVWQHRYFCCRWNWLDFVCIVVFVLDKFAAGLLSFNPHMLRLVRLVRLGRLVRLIRFLESLEALYVMTTAIFSLSRVLGWAVFLLTLILLTCDLFVVQILHSTYFSGVDTSVLEKEELKRHRIMYTYFGTVTRCLLSMFEITLGNWPVIARLLQEDVSQWFIILCLTHKLTVGFAVMGVITGVILQETFKVAQTDDMIMLRTKKRQGEVLKLKLENLFLALDEDNDGRLSLQEFLVICEDPDIKTWLASLDIETDDFPQLFKLCSEDTDGMLSLEEIVHRMPRIRGAARSIDLLTMIDNFRAAHWLGGGDRLEKETTVVGIQSAVSAIDSATSSKDQDGEKETTVVGSQSAVSAIDSATSSKDQDGEKETTVVGSQSAAIDSATSSKDQDEGPSKKLEDRYCL